ncbi:Fic family protein [Chloroflexota bacterium]
MDPFIPEKLPVTSIDWESLIALIGKANRELARYDGILSVMPNPGVLLTPLTTQEAVLSSKIEGTQATFGEVLRFEAGEAPPEESRRLDIEEIINYRRAMKMAEDELKTRPFTLNLLKKLHYILLEGVRGRDKSKGEFRITQNWIGALGTPIEKAQYIPPEPAIIMEYMDNWEKYYHFDRPDPLVQLAIVHAQFEIIHPFLDGNGRLGRMIVPLFLLEKNILSYPMFYISSYFEEYRDEYVSRLRQLGLGENAWERWIEFFLEALIAQANKNATTSRQIFDLYAELKTEVIDLTHSQYAIPMLDQMFKQPIFPSNIFNNIDGMPSKPSINGLLNKLKSGGVLNVVSEGAGRRPQILALGQLLNLCEGKEIFK